jgi:hypothetical protein
MTDHLSNINVHKVITNNYDMLKSIHDKLILGHGPTPFLPLPCQGAYEIYLNIPDHKINSIYNVDGVPKKYEDIEGGNIWLMTLHAPSKPVDCNNEAEAFSAWLDGFKEFLENMKHGGSC